MAEAMDLDEIPDAKAGPGKAGAGTHGYELPWVRILAQSDKGFPGTVYIRYSHFTLRITDRGCRLIQLVALAQERPINAVRGQADFCTG